MSDPVEFRRNAALRDYGTGLYIALGAANAAMAKHTPHEQLVDTCGCGQPWPCDTADLAIIVVRAVARATRTVGDGGLDAALEAMDR